MLRGMRGLLHTGVSPGSTSYLTPGTYTFRVPVYNNLSVTSNGGGGAGINTGTAGSGYASSFGSTTPVVGNGGGQASNAYVGYVWYWYSGSPGTASGGTTNTTGGGAAGGHNNGTGGNGGQAKITWANGSAGAPVEGDLITVVVGAGGTGDTNGANGSVLISWSE